MAQIYLTNIVQNGSFENNVSGWNGFSTNKQGTQSTLAPMQVANNTPAPEHGETGSWCAQIGVKTQGLVYMNPNNPIPTTVGHKYYVRGQVSLRGSTVAGMTTGCTVVNGTTVPVRDVVLPPPLFDGLQTPNVTGWNLIDTIWTADVSPLNMRFIWQQTGNQGNNETYGRVDNIVMVDLTEHFGEGNEPPLFAIRQGVLNTPPHGWWEGTAAITMPVPPAITTDTLPAAIKGRVFLMQIEIEEDTGTAPFVFNISGLPIDSGLFINNNGQLSGVCNLDEGQYTVEVTLTDSIGYRAKKAFILNAGEPPIIHDEYIPGATLNRPYSFTPTVTGSDGHLAVSLAVTDGSLPAGLSIIGTTISGTPIIDNQSCQVTITAFNDYEPGGVSRTYTLNVSFAARINSLPLLPDGIVGVPYSFAMSGYGETPMTWEHVGGSLPPGLSMDINGILSGTPTVAGIYSFSAQVENEYGSEIRLYTLTVYQIPVITTTVLGYARLGRSYSGQLTALGSIPMTWFITDGSLPTGLSLNQSTGIISGIPVVGGNFTFTVAATNTAGVSAPATFTIEAGQSLAIITTSPLPNGIAGTAYTPLTFQADGLDDSFIYAWSWTAQAGSSFPPGLILNGTTGVLSGTPTAIGTYNVNVTVSGGGSTTTAPFTITVGAPPVITSPANLGGGVARPFSTVLQASGTQPISWAMASAPTPTADIRLSSAGVVSWLNPVLGTYVFTVVATNVFGDSIPVQFTITITTPSIIDVDLAGGIVGVPYSHTLTAEGATPFTWSQTFGNLPPGMFFDPATATLSGTPTISGIYEFSVRVDNIGGHAEELFSITIVARPCITTTMLNSGNESEYYSQALLATGTAPISWSVLAPVDDETELPPGVSLTGAVISGMPSTQGFYKFTVMAANITGPDYADTRQFTISIGASGSPIITTGSALFATRGTPYSLTLEATGDQPITWSLNSALPDGLSLNDNILSGTPATAGMYDFTISAGNANGNDARTFTITIADPPAITTNSLSGGTTGTAYQETLSATGDTPISWQIMPVGDGESGLPPGLSLNIITGEIYGSPTTAGIFTFSVRATNGAGYDTATLSIETVLAGGTFINGEEIGNLFIAGEEVFRAFVGGVRIF
ncbi:MAG: putative Ig domain-containing protein [Defluviitaleaceae bacterium]|nr:putative Ig domain-containing protein [Defluviitaleaceae bacterium]